MYERYLDPEGNLAALVVRLADVDTGISFATPEDQTQQLGVMRRPAGYQVEPHRHTPQRREIHDTNEVLFVRSGLVEVTLYSQDQEPYASFQVRPLEAVLLASGGHGVNFIQESIVLEVKQGPYTEIADKVRFDPLTRSEDS